MSCSFIDRKTIPNDFYLSYPSNYKQTKKDWKDIQMIKFHNGLIYYIGSFIPIKEIYEAVNILNGEFYIISQFNSSEEYQQYYHHHYEWYISLDDCDKLWNYYYNNKELIIEVVNDYRGLYD